jgi:5-carboxymethyl-2-hydroxymuconate isomerase
MPHLTVEITSNLEPLLAPDALLKQAHEALLASGSFEGGDVKSRLVWRELFEIGRRGTGEGFVHASLELLAGRPETVRRALSQAVVAALVGGLPRGVGFPVQVSCDVRDMNRDCYAKAIHNE